MRVYKYFLLIKKRINSFLRNKSKTGIIWSLRQKNKQGGGGNQLKILDAGCGNDSAMHTKILLPNAYYVGIDVEDYSTKEKSYADEYWIVNPTEFANFIGRFHKEFDIVLSTHNLEHCNDRVSTLNALLEATKINGIIYLCFPTASSVGFPSRRGVLNYYDDSTHKDEPIDFLWARETLINSGFDILSQEVKYQPFALRILGMVLEPISKIINRNLLGTWEYWGFESILLAKRARD